MAKSKIDLLIKKHEKTRNRGLNLIASENFVSKRVREALSSDLAGRYHTDHYGGSEYIQDIIEITKELAKELFDAKYVFIEPISGNICDLCVIFSFTKPEDQVGMIPVENGGYPLGIKKFDRYRKDIPVKNSSYEIDIEKMQKRYVKNLPELTLLGSSCIPFPSPLREISSSIQEKHPIAYDGSHVLGLIATDEFQDPLNEGVDILFGSTHKSFYGPQGGIIVTNNDEYAYMMNEYLEKESEGGVGLVNNPHPNRIAALGMALEELLDDNGYGKRVVRNAKSLASTLFDLGVPVRFPDKGFTKSHQIFLDMGKKKAMAFCKRLEKEKIFIDISGRIGVAEVTHRGMDVKDMEEIAQKITEVYRGFSD